VAGAVKRPRRSRRNHHCGGVILAKGEALGTMSVPKTWRVGNDSKPLESLFFKWIGELSDYPRVVVFVSVERRGWKRDLLNSHTFSVSPNCHYACCCICSFVYIRTIVVTSYACACHHLVVEASALSTASIGTRAWSALVSYRIPDEDINNHGWPSHFPLRLI
jgi:hypothetical protein